MTRKFIQQDTNRKKSLKLKWRRPKGLQSKLRLNKAGHRKKPSQGFRSSKKERFLVSGSKLKRITNMTDLSNMDGVIGLISSRIGVRKKLDILNKAKEMKVQMLNIKDIEAFIKKVTTDLETRKKSKKQKETEKKKSKEEAVKEAEKKEREEKEEEKKEKKAKPQESPQKTEKPKDVIQKTQPQIARATAPKQK
jgi:large subunit ribosomal protein L32e